MHNPTASTGGKNSEKSYIRKKQCEVRIEGNSRGKKY